jgi:hypothetical protein
LAAWVDEFRHAQPDAKQSTTRRNKRSQFFRQLHRIGQNRLRTTFGLGRNPPPMRNHAGRKTDQPGSDLRSADIQPNRPGVVHGQPSRR